ncbi:MAG: sugar phosphate isomerase/epimerase [Pirellulales bacterium]|nr:sugar phosphate isomerase/epimerase [Pirellulales bacterium]
MTRTCTRRDFARSLTLSGMAAVCVPGFLSLARASAPRHRMKLSLSPGSIGVKAAPRELIAIAHKHGFDAVEPNAAFLAGLGDAEMADLLAEMKAKAVVFGAAGLPVDFRGDEAKFREGMDALPRLANGLKRAGVNRVGTWISPGHDELTYLENFRRHAQRLRAVAEVLKDHGQRLGLEYVGTPSARRNRRYPFLHSLRELRELLAEIGAGNVGCVLDSWHWWTAGETESDLLSLSAADVISVDLNDAPAGILLEQQQDGQRELPCATGVIPVAAFLGALRRIGYDGPVRAEPFNKPLNEMDDDAACAAAIASLQKAMALIRTGQ